MSDPEPDGGRERGTPAEPDDEVARLLRRAGPRPPVPHDVAARVRASVFEHWQERLKQLVRR